jgi:DNA repair exonuclease SbcCD ATPase subunit
MEWPTVITGAYAALATISVALLRRRQTAAESRKTELEGELSITHSWQEYAHGLEARIDRMQGRLDAIEKESHFWREKHIETQAAHTQLKVEAEVLRERVAHVESENTNLRQMMLDNGLTPPGSPPARKKSAVKKVPPRKATPAKRNRKKT